MNPPLMAWMFQIVVPLTCLAMAIYHLNRTRRTGSLSLAALLFLGGMTMWWQEWYADWGAYIMQNPHFALMPWGSTTWTTPYKPWGVIPGYGIYFGAAYWLLVEMIERLRKAKPDLGPWAATTLVVAPMFYLWDLGIETGVTSMGWLTYTFSFGPAITNAHGSFPLVWPITLFAASSVLMVRLFIAKGADGLWPHERILGIGGMAQGFKRELARFCAWAVTMNLMFWFFLTFPLILVRIYFGPASTLVP